MDIMTIIAPITTWFDLALATAVCLATVGVTYLQDAARAAR